MEFHSDHALKMFLKIHQLLLQITFNFKHLYHLRLKDIFFQSFPLQVGSTKCISLRTKRVALINRKAYVGIQS
jgi:hypothetical protein